MEKITLEMMVTEQRFEEFGRSPVSRATMPTEAAYIDGGKVAVEGEITFHGLNVPICQRLTVEITLVEGDPPKREPILGRVSINELP